MGIVNVENDLTAAQKKDLSDKLEKLMAKYTICQIDTKSEDYFAGVVDGLNNAFKLINEIEDDYNVS